MNMLTLYNNCYVILTTNMLDSALEPSYNLSKNLLLLPWILKLIVDMVNDSTPLLYMDFYYALFFQIPSSSSSKSSISESKMWSNWCFNNLPKGSRKKRSSLNGRAIKRGGRGVEGRVMKEKKNLFWNLFFSTFQNFKIKFEGGGGG